MPRHRVFNNGSGAFHSAHPLSASSPIMRSGIPIGPGIPVPRLSWIDFNAAMEARDVSSTFCGAIGGKYTGKTAALKMIGIRYRGIQSVGKMLNLDPAEAVKRKQLILDGKLTVDGRIDPEIAKQMGDVITRTSLLFNDRKHEDGRPDFEPTTLSLLGRVISPLVGEKLNLFGLGLGLDFVDNLEIAHNTAEQINHSQVLTPGQALALRVGMYKMYKICEIDNEPLNPRILRRLLYIQTYEQFEEYEREADKSQFETKFLDKPLLREQLGYDRHGANDEVVEGEEYVPDLSEEEYRNECRKDSRFVYKLFDEFLEGVYNEVFGGEASLVDALSETVLDIDWVGMNVRVRDLLEGVIWKIRTVAMENELLDLYPRLLISDEESDAAKSLLYLRFMFECVKKARAYNMIVLWATQRLQDISEIGQPGSEERRLAEGIIDGMPCMLIFNHVDSWENKQTFNNMQIGIKDQQMIFNLDVGQAGLWTPKRKNLRNMDFMQFVPTPLERPLIFSNSANARQRRHVSNIYDQAAIARLRRHAERNAVPPNDPGAVALMEHTNQ